MLTNQLLNSELDVVLIVCDRPGECSSENNCCWRLMQPVWKSSSSESSEQRLSVDDVISLQTGSRWSTSARDEAARSKWSGETARREK